jgi:hypothetical protein
MLEHSVRMLSASPRVRHAIMLLSHPDMYIIPVSRVDPSASSSSVLLAE